MARSLAERLRTHEQQKVKLAETETKLKEAERKHRNLNHSLPALMASVCTAHAGPLQSPRTSIPRAHCSQQFSPSHHADPPCHPIASQARVRL